MLIKRLFKWFYSVMLLGLLFVPALCMYAEGIRFDGIDLDSQNNMLFTVEVPSATGMNHKSLYCAELTKNGEQAALESPLLLTCFPERLEVFHGGKTLQIRNTSGMARYSSDTDKLTWISGGQNLEKALNYSGVVPPEVAVSPDGNWMCTYLKRTSASADIILENTVSGQRLILVKNAEFRYDEIPVLWAPDSSVLIYEKAGMLYFVIPSQAFGISRLAEEFRKIGPGEIANVSWASPKTLVYINHDMVYKIASTEFFTRALYSDFVGTGAIAGRLANPFDGKKDRFWANEDASALVLVQNNRTLWYLELNSNQFDFVTNLFSYPFVTVPGTAVSFQVFWTPAMPGIKQLPVVWFEMLRSGKNESYVYMLKDSEDSRNAYFEALVMPVFVTDPRLSPDKRNLAFRDENSIHVYNLTKWKQVAAFSDEPVISYAWIDKSSMYVGGRETVSYWNFAEKDKKILFLSSVTKYGWDGDSGSIAAENYAGGFVYNKTRNIWCEGNEVVRPAISQNNFWRAFVGEPKNSRFENFLYVRILTGMSSTRPIVKSLSEKEPYQKKVALVIDCLDNADGLTPILKTLAEYNLKVTFFVNGEFIRRFPVGVNEIVAAGHQCASMFFTNVDLTSTTFVADENFIRRGLARNEDEFFAATGKELSLYWHAPHYFTNNGIILAGKKAGYNYIDAELVLSDLSTVEETLRSGAQYYSAARIIEAVADGLKDGAVLPVAAGVSTGTRPDYLYEWLDVLISAILDKGYKIVPVSEL